MSCFLGKRGLLAATLFLVGAVSGSAAFSETFVWVGGAGGNRWSVAENWSTGTLPERTDDVVFDGSGASACEVDAPVSARSVTIEASFNGVVRFSDRGVLEISSQPIPGGFFQRGGHVDWGSGGIDNPHTFGADFAMTGGTADASGALFRFPSRLLGFLSTDFVVDVPGFRLGRLWIYSHALSETSVHFSGNLSIVRQAYVNRLVPNGFPDPGLNGQLAEFRIFGNVVFEPGSELLVGGSSIVSRNASSAVYVEDGGFLDLSGGGGPPPTIDNRGGVYQVGSGYIHAPSGEWAAYRNSSSPLTRYLVPGESYHIQMRDRDANLDASGPIEATMLDLVSGVETIVSMSGPSTGSGLMMFDYDAPLEPTTLLFSYQDPEDPADFSSAIFVVGEPAQQGAVVR